MCYLLLTGIAPKKQASFLLLLRMHVSSFIMAVRILAVIVSGSRGIRSFIVAVDILLGHLAARFDCCFRLRSRLVLFLAGWLFQFL